MQLVTKIQLSLAADERNNVNELLLQTAAGNETAFTALFDLYWPGVYAHALSFLKQAALAEEISQDIFISIWNNRTKLSAISDFKSFLFIISRNRIFSRLRQKPQLLDDTSLDHIAGSDLTPDARLHYKEFLGQVMQVIEQLPPRKQEVFRMSRLDNLSRKEIAERTGLTYGTVNQYLVDATLFIKTRLEAVASKEMMVLLLFIFSHR